VHGLMGSHVTGVAAGSYHTLVCTAEGQLYTFGNSNHGQLGHGGQENERAPRLVQGLVGKKVVGLAAGICLHSVVWTDAGEVYSFGSGLNGRLGHGDAESVSVPRALPEDAFKLNLC
jgi:alpha-tubulin suppressor-like RCC1 family protein